MTHSFPLQLYAFGASPAREGPSRDWLPGNEGNVSVVVEDDRGTAQAVATAIPMRQNVRGAVLPMAGIAGVATDPLARRQGHVRALLTQLLGDMRDEGHVVTALYPFRASFYARMGYVGLPKRRTATFSPAGLGELLRAEIPGEVTWERIGTGYDTFRAFTLRLVEQRHGFAVFPDFRDARMRQEDDRWLVTARVGGEVTGAALYRITAHGGDLEVDDLLFTDPLSRALLLRFLAGHVDQVSRVVAGIPADELPELWATDIEVVTEGRTAVPDRNAPMARVLSVPGLAGVPAGPGRVTVAVVDDPFVAGTYTLDGHSGRLAVSASGEPTARLRAAGLSALVYGVLDPAELPLRGLGEVPADAAAELRALFPRRVPYVFADF